MENKRKKLNNKGFTLIELLAVVVILAVVMGIAMTSVLSSMNNSRKSSLQTSADSTAQIFQTKYTEAMVSGEIGYMFGTKTGEGYDFTKGNSSEPVFYMLDKTTGTDLNLSKSNYALNDSIGVLQKGAVTNSFIAFNGEKIVACLVAQNGGSYYVAKDAVDADEDITVLGTTVTFKKGVMFACSDEQNSWT